MRVFFKCSPRLFYIVSRDARVIARDNIKAELLKYSPDLFYLIFVL